jgi:putative ABC transport system permease protein
MRIPLRAGRFFTRADNETAPPVVIVNEAFSRKYFPERDAVGQRVILSDEGKPVACEVVGVVANTKDRALSEEIVPQFFAPFPADPGRSVELVVRTAVPNLAGLSAAVRSAVREVDKDLFVPNLEPVSTFVGNQLAQPRFNMILLVVFAAVAMTLAAIGIYGVIAYSVAQRTREIGIRMALGAQRAQMLKMILRQSLTLVAIGLTSGFVVALAATRVMRTLLYGVGANDFSTYAIVFLLLGGAALLASYIPARRAMRVDPIVALRYE